MIVEKTVKKGGKATTVRILDEMPSKGQRPYIILTDEGAEYVAKLASLGCTTQEIADDLGVDLKTLLNARNKVKFQNAVRTGKSTFKTSIRTSQLKIMKNGSASMAIFLGKNYLDQTDQVEMSDAVVSPLENFAKALARYKDD